MKIPDTFRQSRALHIVTICSLVATAQFFSADLAMAQQTSQAFAPLQAVMQAIVDFITGPFGRLCAIIAVISMGFLAFAGRLSWLLVGGVALGIGLVFGGPGIVDALISVVGH
ncbi:TrbC/VirB2 family protein [Rhizobium sp. T1470]|uniref:TrbC/VirB2 family protein n=1 Tax=unclassified Rhizobium TaxID=2613769 RepID=UPI001AAEAFEB|nr:TrbC/VirB2 family protein [Rhizobium sp. T1473]MCA0801313.1 TrbC/VirB2 family protein [Rhizobium sp. T1473]